MDVAIVGAGIAGSSMFRMLSEKTGVRVDLFGIRENQACGIHPCAWMTHGRTFRETMRAFHMPADPYIVRHFDRLDYDGYPVHCDLDTLRKPRLLQDLQGGTHVRYDPVNVDAYDVVVDCTGAARAILPPGRDDLMTPTLQYRVKRNSSTVNDTIPRIRFVRAGYAWSFPLDSINLHIGVGSLWEDLPTSLDRAGYLRKDDTILCECRSAVRVGTPRAMLPFQKGNIWGAGESIGTVSPLVGDGIVPSMQCARLFARDLLEGTLDQYEEHVLSFFSWMEEERAVIDRMIARNGLLGFQDLMVMRNHAERFGLQVSMSWVLSWLLGRLFAGRVR